MDEFTENQKRLLRKATNAIHAARLELEFKIMLLGYEPGQPHVFAKRSDQLPSYWPWAGLDVEVEDGGDHNI